MRPRARASPVWRVLVVLTTIKAGVLILDSTVRLYLGDSAAYLAGAQHQEWLPTDRSFTYSLFLGAFVWPAGRLQALLVWQALAGVAVAYLLWHVLRWRFHAPRAASAAAACALALEPAQLYLERMVLAETLGFLAFAGFFASASTYLARPRSLWLPLVAALGLAAATLRMNYLPVVLVVSSALPMLLLAARARPPHRTVLAHALLAVCSVLVLHTAYRQAVAVVFDVPAAYLPRAGFMQLGLVAPLVTSAQLEGVGLPSGFERELRYPLADRRARMAHMWRPGGLTQTLQAHGFDVEEVARPLSRMALVDNPFGLVRLGVATVGDYFRPQGIRHALHNDLGRRAIPEDLLRTLRDSWGYEAEGAAGARHAGQRLLRARTLVARRLPLPADTGECAQRVGALADAPACAGAAGRDVRRGPGAVARVVRQRRVLPLPAPDAVLRPAERRRGGTRRPSSARVDFQSCRRGVSGSIARGADD